MATIDLRQVEKKFGDSYAVKPLDLTVQDGEFVVLLGPSGCGKTTTLRMISGLETVSGGHILLNGRDVTWRHPSQRDIAFVFQFYALYPHISVHDNIAFPLQAQGESRETIAQRIQEVVALLRIGHLLRQRPGSLSGGDKQRVALARALVRRPAAFLMDEPLGALDAEFREGMRAEIKHMHLMQHATTVYVTHDQVEAMAMGDRIVVMSRAEIQQVGTPAEVYHNPTNLFVARFIGSPGMNLIRGQLGGETVKLPGGNLFPIPPAWRGGLRQDIGDGHEVVAGFRPEAARVKADGALAGEVYAADLHGAYTVLHINIGEADVVHVRADRQINYPIGTPVRFDLDPAQVRFFNPVGEAALRPENLS
ncbi:MAG: ABC transporter ATP-binding protein [Polaromonas sp.]